jgi:FkbM family methyltransferase
MIRQLYRNKVPIAIRKPFSDFRSLCGDAIQHFGRERRHTVARRLRASGKSTAHVRVNGVKLEVDLRDQGVGLPLFVNGSYEASETTFIRSILKKGMCFVDVGANIGYYTTLSSKLVGRDGRVIAVEPDPYNYELLERNIHLNKLNNVTALNVGGGSINAELPLYHSPDGNYGDHRLYNEGSWTQETVSVSVRVLDDVVAFSQLKSLDLLKIDVQGYECHVLGGMRRTLSRMSGLVVIAEYWPLGMKAAGGDPQEFLDYFRELGFDVSCLTERGTESRLRWEQIDDLLPEYPDHPDWNYVNLVFRG